MRAVTLGGLAFLLCVLIGLMNFHTTNALFEDQVGKFDWHQKYFGRIRFLLNDLSQPKRVILGTKDNVIGAVNSNTGAILYRHVFESNSNLLYLSNFEDKSFLAVSSHENQIKVRSFTTSTGIQKEEWIIKRDAEYAGELNRNLYLIDTKTKFPVIDITSYVLKGDKVSTSKEDEFGVEDSKGELSLKAAGNKQTLLALDKRGVCEVAAPYLFCAAGKKVSIVNFVDASVTNKEFPDAGEITEISATSSAELTVVAFKGKGFVKIFKVLANSKAGPELLPISYPVGAHFPTVSQAKVEETTVLFIARLETPYQLQLDAYNLQLEKLPEFSLQITSDFLISSLGVSKGYCHNAQCGIVGFTKDELLFGSNLKSKGSQAKVGWKRMECLASVVAVEMVDYPSEAGQSWNPYSTQQGLISGFIARIKFEIETFVSGESFYSSNDDRFGARKVIVFVTSVGKVVGMDGLTGDILYTFILPEFQTFADASVFLYIQRPAKYIPLKPLASIVYSSSRSDKTTILFPFNPIEGATLGDPQTYPGIVQSQMLLHGTEDTNFLKPVLLMDKNHIVHTYPAGLTDFKNTFFFVADKAAESPVLRGFVVKPDTTKNALGAKPLWDLNIGKASLLGVYGKLPCEKIHSQGRVLPDRSVSYKYMNPNLVVVVTAEAEAGNINVLLLDVVSGAVIHSFWHKKSRGPVHVVHSEHWIVYSLFNEKFRRYEVTSVELYEGQTQSNSSAFSSFASPTVNPIVLKQGYIFPTKVESLAYTRTDKGITNKDILIGLPTGGILELPRFILQPRMNAQHHQVHQDEDGVIHSVPYIPELPIPNEMIINYNQSVKRVRGIKTWPTRLESTCLVLVYGNDIYYTKVAPSKHFDVLKDDFDHWFITIVLVALVIGAYVTKRLTQRKQLEQAWR